MEGSALILQDCDESMQAFPPDVSSAPGFRLAVAVGAEHTQILKPPVVVYPVDVVDLNCQAPT
jgi:hypothetical protein